MIPILYAAGETQFKSNGIGRLLDCIECTVLEERNGRYECTFKYPITGAHYSDIQEGCIIACIHDDKKDIQPFDIYARTAPIDGVVTFYARHISYRLSNVIAKPFTASSCAEALWKFESQTVNDNPFTFWTDKNVTADYTLSVPASVKAMLGGEENSILDVYGTGEYEWDKWTVKLHLHRGQDTDVELRYGKNLVSLTQTYDVSGVYNTVVPYWQNAESGEVVTVDGWVVKATGSGDGQIIVPMDLSAEFESEPTPAELRAEAQRRLDASKSWYPNENIEVDFVALWQTEEYKDIAPLQRLSLCDTASVIYPELGVEAAKIQVITVEYDVMLERYSRMELGSAMTSFAETVLGSVSETMRPYAKKEFVSAQLTALAEQFETELDGVVQTWYQSADPATSWTVAERASHVGDLWYNTTSQKTYRYTGSSWAELTSTPPDEVLEVIEGKAKIFISQPTPPYSVGDLWFNSTTADIMTCVTARATGSYTASDWEKRNRYTDDSSLTTFINGEYSDAISAINSQIDRKIETWYQSSDPATAWTTATLKAAHDGDLWCYTGTTSSTRTHKATYRYQYTATTQIGEWVDYSATDDLFDAIDGKTTIFYGSPTDTYAGVQTNDYLVDPSTSITYRWTGTAWSVVSDFGSMMDTAIANATNLITGGTGGYVVLNRDADGKPNELLIMDTPDTSTAVNVWRFNSGGLGHSSTGYNGPFSDIALTADGQINANMITTGTLSANRIGAGIIQSLVNGNFWNLTSGVFQTGSGERSVKINNGVLYFHNDNLSTSALGSVYMDTRYLSVSAGAYGVKLQRTSGSTSNTILLIRGTSETESGYSEDAICYRNWRFVLAAVFQSGLSTGGSITFTSNSSVLSTVTGSNSMSGLQASKDFVVGGNTWLTYLGVGVSTYRKQSGYVAHVNGSMYVGSTMSAQTVTQRSDEYQKNIEEWDDRYIELLDDLEPIVFTWKDSEDKHQHVGLGARHTKKLLKEKGLEDSGFVHVDDDDEHSIVYSELTVMLLKKVQEQQRIIDNLTTRLEALERRVSE